MNAAATAARTKATKGELTRAAIVDAGFHIVSKSGLEGLTIGALADAMQMSKSGLFAHFGSREDLLLAVLARGQEEFLRLVVNPALAKPRGLARLKAFFTNWIDWTESADLPGGCPMIGGATEFDDKPGPIRDALAEGQRSWIGVLKRATTQAIEQGQLAAGTDPEQISFELFGIALVVHHHRRLLGYEKARGRALAALEALLERHTAFPLVTREEPMQLTLPSLDKISTNVRFLASIAAHRIGLRASSALAPTLAGAWAERLFLTPPKKRLPHASLFDYLDAHAAFVEYRGRNLATWRWGHYDAPAVLLVHGWGGNAGQMRAFVQPLLSAGFRVIVYDQPAHGLSEGKLTGLPDFAGAIEAVAAWHGGVRHVVAHSLGGVATALAISRGLALERTVLVSPPSDMVGYSRHFARWLWIPERVRRAMQAAIEERFGVRWRDFELPRIAPRLRAQALVIHDRGDTMVPWKQGAALARAWPGARLLSTKGLGHGRILEAEGAVRAAVAFIAGRSEVASPAQPALPDPAPLY